MPIGHREPSDLLAPHRPPAGPTSTSAPLVTTKNPTAPASPAAPWFSRARPTATPIAKSRPRLEKIASPAAAIDAMLSRSGCPRRSSRPATGSTAIGSISARPSACVFSRNVFMASLRVDRHEARARARGRASSRTSAAVAARARAARARGTRAASSRRTVRFSRGIVEGVAEISCTPRPMRIGSASTSEPSAPHTATLLAGAPVPLRPRARSGAAPPDAAHRGGARAPDGRGRSRACTARDRWCRWRGSRRAAPSCSASSAEAGVSIIAPTERHVRRPARARTPR